MAEGRLEAGGPVWHSENVAPSTIIDVFVFAFGLVIGSFLNVCIVRIPAGKSIVAPASACPVCGVGIRPYDNIPVISYLLLRGKCRGCKTSISPLYPFIELLTALLFFGCYWAFGLTLEALKWCIFSSLMIVLVFTDLRDRILPDAINFGGSAVGLAFSLVLRPDDGTARWIAGMLFPALHSMRAISLLDALLGAAVGGGLLRLVMEAYFRVRHRDGMGMGDVKMMLMSGAFLGLKRTMLTIFAGSLLGTLLGLAFMLARGKKSDYELPFGSFLGMAALLVVFFGTPVVNWYWALMMGR
jgi:leader peptidase (prepilin peptidase)/N-methyltransferase